MTKEQFLKNLEKVLQHLILDRLFDDTNEEQKAGLRSDVNEFIRENADNYSLEELKETFISAQATIGLFLEYQITEHVEIVPDYENGESQNSDQNEIPDFTHYIFI